MAKVIWRGWAKPDDPIYQTGLVVSGRTASGQLTTLDEALAAARIHLIGKGVERVDEYWSKARATELPPTGMYRSWDEPAWYVWVPPEIDGGPWPALRSSTVIVLSKNTGRVIATGSANDED